MKWLRNCLSVLLVLVVCVLIAPPAKAGIPITGTCGLTITQPGEYDLATNIGPCNTGDGIDITASDVTLHLNGHTITGTPNLGTCNGSFGVRVGLPVPKPMLSHVRVLGDGTIKNFFIGFFAANSNDSFVKFTTVTANCPFRSFGFVILGPGSHWTLQGNVVREPGDRPGIDVERIDDNHLVANDVNDVINLFDSSNNVIANNIADDNAAFGGIFIGTIKTGSNNNEIHANTTNNNTGVGVWIQQGSTGNKVTGNYSFANARDMEDDNPGCDSNKWRGNHFGTANQSCIRSGKDDDSGDDDDRKDDDRG